MRSQIKAELKISLVHPEHEEADEDEGAEEGKQVEAMPGEVESLKSFSFQLEFQNFIRISKSTC